MSKLHINILIAVVIALVILVYLPTPFNWAIGGIILVICVGILLRGEGAKLK